MKRFVLSAVAFVCSMTMLFANEARLLRFPAVGGETVVFSYAGDLYSVSINGGEAKKLTYGDSYDMFAKISPDGKTIAFTGQYDGNTEVYTMPIGGGEPKRITYTAKVERDNVGDRMGPNNIVLGWTPDGKEIIFRSKWYAFCGTRGLVFKVPANGGHPVQIPMTECSWCSYSPDGKQFAFNRMFREFRTWKHYVGGQADEIWLNKVGTTEIKKITDNKNQDLVPMWVGDCIYFMSDRDYTMNLFKYDTKSGATTKVTDFKEYDVKFPAASGKYIVFENGGYIYKYVVATGKCEKVTVHFNDINLASRPEFRMVGGRATSISPDGERALVVARGEIFSVPAENGAIYNLSNTPGAHERDAVWSPDGKWIAYFSDKSGEYQLYLLATDDLDKPEKAKAVTSFKDGYPSSPKWSGDSRFILFSTDKREVYRYDVNGSLTRVLASNDGNIYDVNISPDNKWVAYCMPGDNDMTRIYIHNLASGKSQPVTVKWFDAGSPRWSEDGKYLFFVSDRTYNINYSSVEWNTSFSKSNHLFVLPLTKDASLPNEFKANEFVAAKADSDEAKSEKKGGKKSDKKKEDSSFAIDFDGIEDRAVVLFDEPGGYSLNGMFNGKLYYSHNGKNKSLDLAKMESKNVDMASIICYFPSTKKALTYGNKIIDINHPSSGRSIEASKLPMTIDHRAEWNQMFNESWRVFRDGFYVDNMHGADWKAMHDRYAVMLPYVNHRHDLTYLISEMIGEVSVGHAYITSGETPAPKAVSVGLLGGKFSKDKNGNYCIDYIFEGEDWNSGAKSPLRAPGVNAKCGDYIVAIDGVPASKYTDIYEALVGKTGITVALDINTKSSVDGARRVYVKPIASEQGLAYHDWITRNIAIVDSLSGGKVGYIHIPDMGANGMTYFTKYFYPQLEKKALLIDDRMNGGGNVSPMILERLQREVYRITMGRNRKGGVVPAETHHGPKLCLIDKYSMSDGDQFPHGFRKLGIGKLMGCRTWGGIVGISGSRPYIDGQDMRTPFFTSYSPEGEWLIEGVGVSPDFEVDINPFEDYKGNDNQLNKGVEYLLKEIEKYPSLPGVPAAPVRVRKK
ncbi:MAG: PD40 domain-containing protein [Bacteroidaceae bacterium]|nr:PD40 domain-containing protein [Bacteroidaceae bacterium]